MSTSSQWAAALLPYAPSRLVADRLVTLIEKRDLRLVTSPPACGLTLPPRGVKFDAARAELFAKAVMDPADVLRLQRDSRVGVRRALARNPHTTDEWVASTAQKAVDALDSELFESLAARLSTVRLAQLTIGSGFHSAYASHHLEAQVALASPKERLDVAVALSAAADRPGLTGHGAVDRLLRYFALAPVAEMRDVVSAAPSLAGPLAATVLAVRHIDVEVGGFVLEHADAVSVTMTTTRRDHTSGDCYLTPPGMDVDVVDRFIASKVPDLLAAAVSSTAHLSTEQVDAVMLVEAPVLTLALSRCEDLTLTDAQAEMLAVLVCERADVVIGHAGYGHYRRPVYDQLALAAALERPHPWSTTSWLSMLRAGSWQLTELWLLGKAGAVPRPGEIASLLADPGRSLAGAPRDAVLDTAATVADKGCPWSAELAQVASPSAVESGWLSADRSGVKIIADKFASASPDDPEVWSTLVALAPNWPDSTDDLLATAIAVAG